MSVWDGNASDGNSTTGQPTSTRPLGHDVRNNADGSWNYIEDTATAWCDAQKTAGKTDAEVASYLAQFDKVDRYDYDGDDNFNEPDGCIGHFPGDPRRRG